MLSQVSDEDVRKEYKKRFTIPFGATISSSDGAIDHLRQYFEDQSREAFVVIFLNGRNAHIKTERIFEGTLTSSVVYPRELVKAVLACNAAALILSHNHPSGNLSPSQDDKVITEKVVNACKMVVVAVHDHLIVTSEGFFSFAEHGLMK